MQDKQFSTVLSRAGLVSASIFFAWDLVSDFLEGEGALYQLTEGGIFLFILGVLIFQTVQEMRIRAKLAQYVEEVKKQKNSLDQRIKDQFDGWSLTPSESETAWLIIKGFSFEEIAGIRSVKGKTARQQATSIYAKSGATSRSEFTGLFIDDILNSKK
ncbi:MAG: hypothetical protein GKR96_14615 [Gammaproteobacteria bacterium]|nr:hypothetical protein [Gammaproteobacteria bacterium]